MRHPVVYVSGAPGSGKTTVAEILAQRLGLPLLCKDVVKESLFDSLPVPPITNGDEARSWSRTLGAAAMELLWRLAAGQQTTIILEANFRPKSPLEHDRLVSLERPLVEVYCWCPPEVAMSRYAARAEHGDRRADVHPLRTMTPEHLAEFDGPVGLGHRVDVDTSIDARFPDLAGRVQALLELGTHSARSC